MIPLFGDPPKETLSLSDATTNFMGSAEWPTDDASRLSGRQSEQWLSVLHMIAAGQDACAVVLMPPVPVKLSSPARQPYPVADRRQVGFEDDGEQDGTDQKNGHQSPCPKPHAGNGHVQFMRVVRFVWGQRRAPELRPSTR